MLKKSESFLLISGIVLAAASMRAPVSTIGPLTRLIQADLGMSSAAAGMLTTIPLILFAVFSPIAGKYLPRFRTGSVVCCCLAGILGGSLLRAWAGLPGLYLGILALGAGIGTLNVLLTPLIRENFSTRIGLMMGIYNSSLNLFSGLGSGLSALLAQSLGGWRPTSAIWSLTALLGLPIWLAIRRRGMLSDARQTQTETRLD